MPIAQGFHRFDQQIRLSCWLDGGKVTPKCKCVAFAEALLRMPHKRHQKQEQDRFSHDNVCERESVRKLMSVHTSATLLVGLLWNKPSESLPYLVVSYLINCQIVALLHPSVLPCNITARDRALGISISLQQLLRKTTGRPLITSFWVWLSPNQSFALVPHSLSSTSEWKLFVHTTSRSTLVERVAPLRHSHWDDLIDKLIVLFRLQFTPQIVIPRLWSRCRNECNNSL